MTVVDRPTVRYSSADLERDLRWWAAANYLTAAQIYLQDNVLLREPLTAEHIKPRLLGHWGTSPGLSAVYVQLNRLVRRTGTPALYVTGPGHGGPALVANTYLEGSYSEFYPDISEDAEGLRRLVRQFSTPGGIPSHVSVQTPGSIHEGGELGYALAHAAGAAFDHPDLLVCCVIGDGEAETGPLAASWRLPAFLDARRDGAVLPVLHLNGYKISGPTVMGRQSDADVCSYLSSQGWDPVVVSGHDPAVVFADLEAAVAGAHDRIRAAQDAARSHSGDTGQARWPAIVLRTPKGWTGPAVVDGVQIEGTQRAHQVPLAGVRENPAHLALLEEWLRSYRPQDLFDADGRLVPEVKALAPEGDLRLGASPYANGGLLREPLDLPDLREYAIEVRRPGGSFAPTTHPLGELLRDVYQRTSTPDGGGTFRLFSPDETASNKLDAVFEVTDRCLASAPAGVDGLSPHGRVMEVLSEHLCEGWLEGYVLSGRHGFFATYEAFAMVSASMLVQHVKWLQHSVDVPWRAPVSSLNVLLTSTCWRNDHNGFSHQGPGLIDTVLPLAPGVARVYLPPDANCLLSIARHCLLSTDHVNLVVADKQPHLQYLTLDEAEVHCALGASAWTWAGNHADADTPDGDVDVVLACAGDVPTQEALAAAEILREHAPALRVRFVNVVDLMALMPRENHPHGLDEESFRSLFGDRTEVVMAFHGYPRAVHQLLHGRPAPQRFHVRGFEQQGTTTTPFDMVVLNRMSRFHLVLAVLEQVGEVVPSRVALTDFCEERLREHHGYVREHFEDLPQIREWTWNASREGLR